MSDEQKRKLSLSKMGKPAWNRKPIKCVEIGKVFGYAKEALQFLNINIKSGSTGHLSSCAKDYDGGKVDRTAYGYHWSFNI